MAGRKKEKYFYDEGGEPRSLKMKDEVGRRIKRMRQEKFNAVRDVTSLEYDGIPVAKRNRGLRRQPLRKHK